MLFKKTKIICCIYFNCHVHIKGFNYKKNLCLYTDTNGCEFKVNTISHLMDSLFHREYIKTNFNTGLFEGLLLNCIVSVILLLFLLYSDSLKKFLQICHLGTY